MGAWGVKLYQDDVACDVRDQFKDLLHRGKTTEEITKQMIDEYSDAISDTDDGPVFWFALADTQWNLGRLLPEVKKQAIGWLDKGGDLARWKDENTKMAAAREKVLKELKEKLNSPQPAEKKVLQYRLYKCEWNIGDVFAYRLESDMAKEKGLSGRYFLIQKVDEGTWHPGHIIPIVYVKITKDGTLPSSIEEIKQAEYVQTSFAKYEERFWPIDGRRPEEDIAEKSKIKYEVDEFGFLPQYRIKLISTSRKIIPSKLIFIGNFSEYEPPKKEFVPHEKINIRVVEWKKFEENLMKRYCNHNLRQLSIYQKTNQV